ncbi:MAG: O-antigen ligase family protein [Alphaproteobacteria bacterium]|nr:O-antigen ligase family protein [Alphaproteobacteria bacterium]
MLRALTTAPLPVTLVILSFLCPTELSLFLGGLRLPPHRIALIVLFPIVIYRLLFTRKVRLQGFDLVFFAFNIWTVAVFTHHSGAPDGLVYGGSLALESLGAYLVARTYVRDFETLRNSLKVMLMAIAAAAVIALPETLLGQNFAHDFMRALTGYEHPIGNETRLGLTRAYSTFDHPIHYGTFCAGLLTLFLYAERRFNRRIGRGALVGGATFLGLSSAPMLCLALQFSMIMWDWLTRGIRSRALMTFALIAGAFIGVSLISDRGPVGIIATGLTLDSWTGYYRMQIWTNGLKSVWNHPWTGIGLADWDRPWWMVSDTIDAFWLVIAMREGIPALILLALAIAMLVMAAVSRGLSTPDRETHHILRGWIISLIALCMIGATVHFWNVLYAYFFFFLGLGGVLADPMRRKPKRSAEQAAGANKNSKPRIRRAPKRPRKPVPEAVWA